MNAISKPTGAYNIIDHTYDVVVVGAGGAGLRHLAWDLGYGWSLPEVYKTGQATIIATAVLTVLIWIVGLIAWA